MEKKKFLLVAVSVGVFLVIVIAATILLTTPKNGLALAQKTDQADQARADTIPISPGRPEQSGGPVQETDPATVDASTLVRNPGGVQGLESPPSSPVQPDSVFYVYGEDPAQRTQTIIDVPKPSAVAVPEVRRQEPAARPSRTAEAPSPAETPARAPATRTAAPAAPARTATSTAPAVTTPARTTPARTQSDYWVQTGAFSTKARADGVKETLASKGITSVVDVQDVNSATFYRVRVGPYTSENEAGYWLSLVKTIDGFGDSQIRVSQSRR
ncbi:MAG: SPOR domain-containing protein [Spirochaetaceae bacterium]|jgi:DedD protein|nr:SPOR domain-containing protein [Spirochaetaceae bacterium]